MNKSALKQIAKKAARPVLNRIRPGNIAMIHIGRCGSTVLGHILQQDTRIYWASELYEPYFQRWREEHGKVDAGFRLPEDALDILRESMASAMHRYYGFELKPFHLRLIDYSPEAFFKHLKSLNFTHYIILNRKNRLRKITSSVIASKKAGSYHIKSDQKADLKTTRLEIDDIRIDYDAKPLLNFLEDYDRQFENVNNLLTKRKNVLHLTYEEDIQDNPQQAYERMCAFLGMEPKSDAPIKLSRTNPFPLSEIIENYDEVSQTLANTPYAWMLKG